MKTAGPSRNRTVAGVLAVALAAPLPPAAAGMIGAEDLQAVESASQAERDRAKVESFMERATVRERLQAMGVSGVASAARVASLSDAEVHALAQRIDTLPAGGELSNQDLIIILLVAILVVLVL